MNKKTATLSPLILLAVLVLAAPLALAGDAPAVVGAWSTVAVTPDGELPGVMTITEKDGALDVEMDIGGTVRRVEEEQLEGDTLTMTVIYDGSPYEVELKVAGDTMEGTYTGAAASGALTAKRQP